MSKSTAYKSKKTGKPINKKSNPLVLIMALVALLIVAVAGIALSASGSGAQFAEIGGQAPTFTLPTVNGETLDLAEYSGKPVVLNFWATWCPPCRHEIPELASFSTRYDGEVAVIGISTEPLATVRPFVDTLGIPYPIAIDSATTVNDAYLIRSLPTSVIIDSDGVVRQVITGAVTEQRLAAEIERLLSAQDAEVAASLYSTIYHGELP